MLPPPGRVLRTGPIPFANDPCRCSHLSVTNDLIAPLAGANHLSTALVDYLLHRSISMSSNLRDDVLIGSSNSFSYFQLMNKKNSGSLDQHEAMSVNSARLQYQHYSRKRYEFISPCCSHNHFFAVKVIFDVKDPSIFSEVCVYDSLRRTGRRTDAVNRHAPPAQYLCQLQLFLAQFCFVGLPQSEVLAKNPEYILRNAVYAPCPVQENGHDCALFAFASVLHIVHGHALSAVTFTQQNITQLRDGLNTVLTCNTPDVNTPDPKKFLSSTFLWSFFPCLSEKENDDVFLKLVYKKSENTSPEVQQSKRNPAEGKQADEVLTDIDSTYRPVPDDPQPEAHHDIVSDPSVAYSLPGPATNIVEVPRTLDDVFTSMFMDVPTIFEDMSQVDLAMDKYEESSGVRVIIAKSCKGRSRLYLCASHEGCCFRAKFGSKQGMDDIMLKSAFCVPYHSGPLVPGGKRRRAPKRRLRGRLKHSVELVMSVKEADPVPKDVMRAAANHQKKDVTYNQSFRAIQEVRFSRAESQLVSFQLIRSYIDQFLEKNPDSTVRAECDGNNHIERVGIVPGIMKRAMRLVRPVMSLDGAHLKSKWGGTLYVASVKSACNEIYPVGFAIMNENEDEAGWLWFLELLRSTIDILVMDHPRARVAYKYFSFILDRQKGLVNALQRVFPDNHPCFCSVHLARNAETKGGKKIAKLVHSLATTFSGYESRRCWAEIEQLSSKGRAYLEGIPKKQWQGTAWIENPSLPPRFGIVTTNMSESANSMLEKARSGSWLDCIDQILSIMLERICTLREKHRGRSGVVDEMRGILETRWNNCAGFQVWELLENGGIFRVCRTSRGPTEPERSYVLNIREQTCECGKWQDHEVPCINAIAYYKKIEKQTLQYIIDNHVSGQYKFETVNELLKDNIIPVCLETISADGITLPPNVVKRRSGRPKKVRLRKRTRFAHDPQKSNIRCSRCKKTGHNVRTCLRRDGGGNADLDLS
ncbi:MULE transposase domain containing protein [Nitzschia inconspicua]|uniref:MULE transposase domain containing protein n=1 Tax=Nitzschia inconspicua TaxID=303405 RepID=A0A9K3M3A4_9STRA|nr:MULE transposase domain containing protein [Nitzschia inconspicua]